MKKTGPIVLVIVAVVVVAGLVAWLLGYVNVGIKQPSQKVVLHQTVCSDALIGRYNAAIQASTIDGYDRGLKAVVADVEKQTHFEKDPNCLFMAYMYYFQAKDIAKSKAYVKQLKALSESGDYLSGLIANPSSVEQMQNNLQSLENQDSGKVTDAG